jgi:hypothetical protein
MKYFKNFFMKKDVFLKVQIKLRIKPESAPIKKPVAEA